MDQIIIWHRKSKCFLLYLLIFWKLFLYKTKFNLLLYIFSFWKLFCMWMLFCIWNLYIFYLVLYIYKIYYSHMSYIKFSCKKTQIASGFKTFKCIVSCVSIYVLLVTFLCYGPSVSTNLYKKEMIIGHNDLFMNSNFLRYIRDTYNWW